MTKSEYVIEILENMQDAVEELSFEDFQYVLQRINKITTDMLKGHTVIKEAK